MKIEPRNTTQFLKSPNKNLNAILVYGPDCGLVSERAKTLCHTIVDDLNDPFSVSKLTGEAILEDSAILADEASAIPMLGGDKLVHVTSVGNKNTPAFKEYLANPSNGSLVVLEAGALAATSSLRKLFETSDNAAALACYVEGGGDLIRTINDLLAQQNCKVDRDAAIWLASAIDGDRAKVRGELEKLSIYHGNSLEPITLDEAKAVCADAGSAELDELAYALSSRKPSDALKAYSKLDAQGVAIILILRTLQNHFRKLHLAKKRLEDGEQLDKIIKSLRIFFKQAPAFKAGVQALSSNRLLLTLERLCDLEARCKKTGAPINTLCSQAFLSIAR